MNENIYEVFGHDFKDKIQDHTLNNEQLKVFELLIGQPIGLHIL